MTKQGNSTAYQQLRPVQFDATKGYYDAENLKLNKSADKRANDYLELHQRQYQDGQNEKFANKYGQALSLLNPESTGIKPVDTKQYELFNDVRERLFALQEQYGNEMYSNPAALAEYNSLMNTAKLLNNGAANASAALQDLTAGMQPVRDEKGNWISPKYNKMAEEHIDFWNKVVNGDHDWIYVNGRYGAVVNGKVMFIDDAAKNNFGTPSQYVSYEDFLKEEVKNIGSVTKIWDEGNQTYKETSFESIAPVLRKKIESSFGNVENLSDLAKTYLTEVVGLDYSKVKALDDDGYNEMINGIMDHIQAGYKSSVESGYNTKLMSVQESQRHNKATESISQQNADTSWFNAQTSRMGVEQKGSGGNSDKSISPLVDGSGNPVTKFEYDAYVDKINYSKSLSKPLKIGETEYVGYGIDSANKVYGLNVNGDRQQLSSVELSKLFASEKVSGIEGLKKVSYSNQSETTTDSGLDLNSYLNDLGL